MPKQKWLAEETHGGWLVWDEENPDDTAAHVVVKGHGAQELAARVANALNATELVQMVLDDMDTCCGECGAGYQFKELSTETVEALRAFRPT
ncbi:MAG: hypothetical protein EKK53_11190 [Burkholderiales bacterium]|nr:MAG: hypothetical protein EKK53_11190 [Burkholderiales bacterium]